MAIERFIRHRIPKMDGGRHNHDGRHANQMREDAAMEAQAHELTVDQADSQYTRPIDLIPGDQEIVLFFPEEGVH